jgi:hypothetical protein
MAPLQLKPRVEPAVSPQAHGNPNRTQVIDMNDPILTLSGAPNPDAATRRALLVCGLWMRAGFIGASATAVGVIQLFDADWSILTALSTAATGIALAAFGWARAHAALSSQAKLPELPVATPAAAHR